MKYVKAPREASRYRFDEFVLDVPNRQLGRGDTRLDMSDVKRRHLNVHRLAEC